MIIELIKMANQLDKAGDLVAADHINKFIEKLAQNPEYDETDGVGRLFYQKGSEAYAKKNYQRAIEYFTEGNKAVPKPAFFYNIGMCYVKMGDFQNAERNFEIAKGKGDSRVDQLVEKQTAKMSNEETGANATLADNLVNTIVNTVKSVGREVDQKEVQEFVEGILASQGNEIIKEASE